MTWVLRERLIDAALLAGAALAFALLVAVAKMVVVYVFCGLFFMAVAAYTLIQGQMAKARRTKWAWFVCTGAVLFLFSYWALQVVFRPPKVKTSIGCGGVKFANSAGETVDLQQETLRTEL